MVRRRSLRRRSIKKSLRSRRRSKRSLRPNGYDLRSRRRKASYRFGAEQQSLISDFIQIAKISPQAAASIIKFGLTALMQKYDVKEPGAINMKKYIEEVKPLYDYLEEGLTPMKFGVDLLNMPDVKKAAKEKLAERESGRRKKKKKMKKKHTIKNYPK